MSDIKRWTPMSAANYSTMRESTNGKYVLLSDHLAAVAAAEQKVRDEAERSANGYGRFCYRLALDKSREAVAALSVRWAYPSNVVDRDDALAAIDALKGENNG